MERNPLFYDDTLNSGELPRLARALGRALRGRCPRTSRTATAGERERELVQRGLPYLKQVWGDANWQLFRVNDPTPLAEPPAVVRAGRRRAS